MHELTDGLILYHGSYCEVRQPDIGMCAKRKDFGQGFYLTTSYEQAARFLKTAIAKAAVSGRIAVKQDFGDESVLFQDDCSTRLSAFCER